MLTVANGLDSVPSPLKSMPSTMAFGTATPPTMFHPCVANRYEPRSMCASQVCAEEPACVVPDMPNAIAATTRPRIIVFLSLVFIAAISFFFVFIGRAIARFVLHLDKRKARVNLVTTREELLGPRSMC